MKKKKRIKELQINVEDLHRRLNTLEKAIHSLEYRCPPKKVEWNRFTPLPPIPTSEYLDEKWIEKPALVGDRQRVADFLKELLKEDRNAYTIVVTKDLVYLLYKIAKEKLNDEMLSQGENTRAGE